MSRDFWLGLLGGLLGGQCVGALGFWLGVRRGERQYLTKHIAALRLYAYSELPPLPPPPAFPPLVTHARDVVCNQAGCPICMEWWPS